MAFVEMEKYFDYVDWNKWFVVLRNTRLKYGGRIIIAIIYKVKGGHQNLQIRKDSRNEGRSEADERNNRVLSYRWRRV